MISFYERIRKNEFENKLPYPISRTDPLARREPKYLKEREAYRAEDTRLRDLFKTELLKELGLTDHPNATAFFEKCWQEGHSGGYSEIYNVALEWADILRPPQP